MIEDWSQQLLLSWARADTCDDIDVVLWVEDFSEIEKVGVFAIHVHDRHLLVHQLVVLLACKPGHNLDSHCLSRFLVPSHHHVSIRSAAWHAPSRQMLGSNDQLDEQCEPEVTAEMPYTSSFNTLDKFLWYQLGKFADNSPHNVASMWLSWAVDLQTKILWSGGKTLKQGVDQRIGAMVLRFPWLRTTFLWCCAIPPCTDRWRAPVHRDCVARRNL